MAEALCIGEYRLSNKKILEECCPGCPVKEICYIEGVVYGETGTWGESTESSRKYLPIAIKRKLTLQLWREGKFELNRCREPLRASVWIADEKKRLEQLAQLDQIPPPRAFPEVQSFSFPAG